MGRWEVIRKCVWLSAFALVPNVRGKETPGLAGRVVLNWAHSIARFGMLSESWDVSRAMHLSCAAATAMLRGEIVVLCEGML